MSFYAKKENESQKEFEERIFGYLQKNLFLRIRDFEIIKQLSDSFIDQNSKRIEFNRMLIYNRLPEDFLRKYFDRFLIRDLCMFQKNLSENFIIDYADKLDWNLLCCNQKLKENILREFASKLNFKNISSRQKLSESFISYFKDKLDWVLISKYQKLSEDFIERHSLLVNWENISRYQKLSEAFIEKFSDKLIWANVFIYQKISKEFCLKHKNKMVEFILATNKVSK